MKTKLNNKIVLEVLDTKRGRKLLAEAMVPAIKYNIFYGHREYWPKSCLEEEKKAEKKLTEFILKNYKKRKTIKRSKK